MLRHVVSTRLFWVVLATLLIDAKMARAVDAYYMIVFGQQDGADRPDSSHTFATFVKTTGEGADKTKYTFASHTISWMPASLHVKLLHGRKKA